MNRVLIGAVVAVVMAVAGWGFYHQQRAGALAAELVVEQAHVAALERANLGLAAVAAQRETELLELQHHAARLAQDVAALATIERHIDEQDQDTPLSPLLDSTVKRLRCLKSGDCRGAGTGADRGPGEPDNAG